MAGALTVNSTIGAGTAVNFVKAGNGLMILGGTNTFTGNTFINDGVVKLGGTTAATLGTISTAGNVTTIRQGGSLDINNSGPSTTLYTSGLTMNLTTLGVVNAAGTITNSSATTSAVSFGSATSTTAAGVISSVISGTNIVVVRNSAAGATGIQALTGLNTYTGPTIIKGGGAGTGILQANVLASGGTASSIGASSNAASNLVFEGGTLLYQGANTIVYQTTQTPSVSIDRLFTIAGAGASSATIDSSGTYGNNIYGSTATQNNAALVFNGTNGSGGVTGTDAVVLGGTAGAKTLQLQGNSTGDNAINLVLADGNGSTLAVTKTGVACGCLGISTTLILERPRSRPVSCAPRTPVRPPPPPAPSRRRHPPPTFGSTALMGSSSVSPFPVRAFRSEPPSCRSWIRRTSG